MFSLLRWTGQFEASASRAVSKRSGQPSAASEGGRARAQREKCNRVEVEADMGGVVVWWMRQVVRGGKAPAGPTAVLG